jgi:hypothetical protein
MQLKEFGKRYPFLRDNLAFWECYIKARDELFQLLFKVIGLELLKQSDFLQNMEQGKPLLSFHDIRISEGEISSLVESFCRNMGFAPRTIERHCLKYLSGRAGWGNEISIRAGDVHV